MDIIKAVSTLGVPYDADEAILKKHYRSLAMKYHPDRGGNVEQMQEINSAYNYLTTRDLTTRQMEWMVATVDLSTIHTNTAPSDEELLQEVRNNMKAINERHLRLSIALLTLPLLWAIWFMLMVYGFLEIMQTASPNTSAMVIFLSALICALVSSIAGFALMLVSRQVIMQGWSSVLGGLITVLSNKDFSRKHPRLDGLKEAVLGLIGLIGDLIALPFVLVYKLAILLLRFVSVLPLWAILLGVVYLVIYLLSFLQTSAPFVAAILTVATLIMGVLAALYLLWFSLGVLFHGWSKMDTSHRHTPLKSKEL